MAEQAPEVFISFADEDGLSLARALGERMRREGITYWFEPEEHEGR